MRTGPKLLKYKHCTLHTGGDWLFDIALALDATLDGRLNMVAGWLAEQGFSGTQASSLLVFNLAVSDWEPCGTPETENVIQCRESGTTTRVILGGTY